MFTLKAESRSMDLKPKQLRKKGIIPGVLYGKNLEESLSIQFAKKDATSYLRANTTGSKAELVIGDKKYPALLREAVYKITTGELEHLSFQTLLAGEPVISTARIVLLNREKISALIQNPQSEITYRALPAHLIDTVEVDLEGMKEGDSIRISDLDIAKNPDIEILNPLDTMVVSIVEGRKLPEVVEEAEDKEPNEESQ